MKRNFGYATFQYRAGKPNDGKWNSVCICSHNFTISFFLFSYSKTIPKKTYSCVCHMEKLSPFASKQTAKTVWELRGNLSTKVMFNRIILSTRTYRKPIQYTRCCKDLQRMVIAHVPWTVFSRFLDTQCQRDAQMSSFWFIPWSKIPACIKMCPSHAMLQGGPTSVLSYNAI